VFIFGNILQRMIFIELVKVFSLALTGLTGLFLIGLVIQNATALGLSLGQTLTAIPLLIPYTLPYTIPTTTLFATCVVYGRLSKDNEALAMRSVGVNLYTLLRPAVTLGVITCAVTFALAHSVIPHTQMALQERVLRDPEELLYNLLRRERTFRAGNFPYVIHVRDVQGRRLIDLVLKRWKMVKDANGKDVSTGTFDVVVRAREARLRVQLPDAEHPNDPAMLFIDPDRWVLGDGALQLVSNGNGPIGVPLPDMFTPRDIGEKPVNLTWDRLPGKTREFEAKFDAAVSEYERESLAATKILDPVQRRGFDDHVTNLKYITEHWLRQVRNTLCEYHMRPALALSCLVFALVGVPVGLYFHRADYLSSFVTCFLPTVFAFYPLLLAGSNMGRDGKVPMAVGVYAADALMGAVAALLAWRLIKR
jgi:lipopolysaccharide export system permease protein